MESPPQPQSDPGWFQPIVRRVFTWWPAKMVGTTLGMAVFFVVYFWVLHHPLRPATMMPLTTVDWLIGFRPWALPLYLSLWFYVSLAPALLIDRRELVSYAMAAVVMSAIGLGIFLVWPTAVPRPDVDWSRHPAFAFLNSVDASGNACPSLHVAFAVFTAVWFERLGRQMGASRLVRTGNWLWCAGIVFSTVATAQHVALDAVAGSGLGLIVAAGHLRWLRGSAGSHN